MYTQFTLLRSYFFGIMGIPNSVFSYLSQYVLGTYCTLKKVFYILLSTLNFRFSVTVLSRLISTSINSHLRCVLTFQDLNLGQNSNQCKYTTSNIHIYLKYINIEVTVQ